MKSNYVARACKFMNQFLAFAGDFDINNTWEVSKKVKEFNYRYNRKVIVSSGSCRIALITADYVIKWDYNKNNVNNFGGCKDELQNYRMAAADGYDYLLAKITPFTNEKGTFYVMPRIKRVASYENRCIDLEDFLTRDEYRYICNNFRDLHLANWGVIGNSAIIFDYAATYH